MKVITVYNIQIPTRTAVTWAGTLELSNEKRGLVYSLLGNFSSEDEELFLLSATVQKHNTAWVPIRLAKISGKTRLIENQPRQPGQTFEIVRNGEMAEGQQKRGTSLINEKYKSFDAGAFKGQFLRLDYTRCYREL